MVVDMMQIRDRIFGHIDTYLGETWCAYDGVGSVENRRM